MTPDGRLRFGIFLAPFHPVGQNPTLALERDLQLIEHLDELGFDEAWIGEHHSAGYEIIASPEVFIAAAAQRTTHIRLGTGVSSLPYHHPFMLADRMVLLDHLTRGRVMIGVGPGALPSDAFMMGIDPATQRDMMEEALEAILAAAGRRDGDHGDRLVHAGQSAAAAAPLPAPLPRGRGGRPGVAGRPACGRSLRLQPALHRRHLDRAASTCWAPTGTSWRSAPTEFGTTVNRNGWRLVGPMHIADTKEQAVADVAFGLEEWVDYFQRVAALPLAPNTETSSRSSTP